MSLFRLVAAASLASLLTPVAALACPGIPVPSQELVLLGRGWINKENQVRIALACTDTECLKARFVYFEGRTACHFGNPLILPRAETKQLQDRAIRAVVQAFFFTHHTPDSAEKIDRAIVRRGALLIGGLLVTGLAVAGSGGTLLPFAAMAASGVTASYLMTSSGEMESIASGRWAKASLQDQNGWSWDAQPKKINEGRFRDLASRIQRGQRLQYMKAFGSGDRDDKLEGKMWRVRKRLERKGVNFEPNTPIPPFGS